MIVCICHDVKDRQIKAAMTSGVDSLSALKDNLSVATCCGCCEPMVNDLLDEHHAKASSSGEVGLDSQMDVNQLAYAI